MSYRAPFGCPSPEQFVAFVESRSALIEPELGPAAADVVDRVRADIRADPAAPGWMGTIRIEGSLPLERAVRGEHCEDVASALALIAVLRLEPERAPQTSGARAGNAPSSTAAPSAAPSPETNAPAAGTPAVTPPAPTSEAPVAAAGASSAPPLPSTVIPPSGPRAPDASATAPATTAPAPSAAPPNELSPPNLAPSTSETAPSAAGAAGPPAAASESSSGSTATTEAAPGPSKSEGAASRAQGAEPPAAITVPEPDTNGGSGVERAPRKLVLSLTADAGYAAAPAPSLELALGTELRFGDPVESWIAAASLVYRQGSRSSASGDLSLRLIGAELRACPFAFRIGMHAWTRICAELDAGVLAAAASERELPIEASDKIRPWLALGPSLQLGIPLGTRLSLRLLAQGEAVLIRDHFDVARIDSSADVTLYRPPALSVNLLLGVGYAF